MTKDIRWKLVLMIAFFPVSALAQLPLPTGHTPVVSASFGYSNVLLPIPSSTRIDLNGVDGNITVNFPCRLGARADLSYDRASNVFSTGHPSNVLSYMVGPLFYITNNDQSSVFIQGLAGFSRVTGVVPVGAGAFDTAFTVGPSWAIGAGFERRITSSLAIRTETDYLHTTFTDSSAAFRGQSDLRFTSSIVYRWGGGGPSEGRRDHKGF